jgi:uncharacterized protein YcnI
VHQRRRLARGALCVCAATGLTLVSTPAWAHVEVETNHAYAGAKDVTLTFHVPNEEAPATTRSISFVFPTDHPLLGVTTTAQNGFTPTSVTVPLLTPVQGPHGLVHRVVRTVEFRGGRLSGTEEKAFTFHVDQLPSDTRALTFKALQKYSSGRTVAWIEVAAPGSAEPEHPAPVLLLGPARAAGQPATAGTVARVPLSAKALATRGVAGAAAPGSGVKVPLVAGVGGLVLVAGGWALWWRRRRPSGRSPGGHPTR